jgi:hypothetical protein
LCYPDHAAGSDSVMYGISSGPECEKYVPLRQRAGTQKVGEENC